MSNTAYSFEKLDEMKLNHLPNDAKLILQRVKGDKIPDDAVQFYIATTFVNSENNQTVWNKGPSIQLEQIPEFVEKLSELYKKYSGKNITESKTEKTVTFADSTYAKFQE